MKLPSDDMFIPRWPSLHTGLCHVPACQNVSQNIHEYVNQMKKQWNQMNKLCFFVYCNFPDIISLCAHEHYVCVNACSPVDVEKDPRWRNWQKTELFFFSSPGRRLFSRPVSQFFHSNLKVITAHLKKRHLSQLCKSQQPDTFDRFVEDTCKL